MLLPLEMVQPRKISSYKEIRTSKYLYGHGHQRLFKVNKPNSLWAMYFEKKNLERKMKTETAFTIKISIKPNIMRKFQTIT